MSEQPEVELLYQKNPIYYQKQAFKPKSWTESVIGYINKANELSLCILRNRNIMTGDYAWAVAINFEAALPPQEISDLWTKVKRKLEARGVVALWVREPSASNHCNYHMIVDDVLTKDSLERAIEDSLPPRSEVSHHKKVERIVDQYRHAFYITKGKIQGFTEGRAVADVFADKRLLFKANLGLRKHGTIGRFWAKPMKQLWDEIRAFEKQIAEGLQRPGMRALVKHLHEMLGETVPIRRIERSLGRNADSPNIQAWLDHLHEEGDFPGGWDDLS